MSPEQAGAIVDEAWRAHHDALRARIHRSCGNKHLAEDVAAESFVRLLRHLTQSDGQAPTHMFAWLHRVARNLLTDHYRTPSAHREVLAADPREGASSVRGDFESVERSDEIAALLDCLTEHQRAVLVLRCLGDLSVTETATVLGMTNQAVRSLKHAAKRRLLALATTAGDASPICDDAVAEPAAAGLLVAAAQR